jgi:hypothetical protein
VSPTALRRELPVFVEGRRTEAMSLVGWHRRGRGRVRATIDPYRAGPLQLVERAVAAQRAEAYDARRARGRAHDQIWCVFDRDEHPNFASAVDLAAHHGIRLAMSNPCIELWFLLHFEDQTAFIDRRERSVSTRSTTATGRRRGAIRAAGCGESSTRSEMREHPGSTFGCRTRRST